MRIQGVAKALVVSELKLGLAEYGRIWQVMRLSAVTDRPYQQWHT